MRILWMIVLAAFLGCTSPASTLDLHGEWITGGLWGAYEQWALGAAEAGAEYHMHLKYLIHAAVNRTTLNGTPEGGWFPEQKITVHEALQAFTINNAHAAFEEHLRGSIKAGKLADIAVCDRNLLEIDPLDILNMEVGMTIVDGRIVFEKGM